MHHAKGPQKMKPILSGSSKPHHCPKSTSVKKMHVFFVVITHRKTYIAEPRGEHTKGSQRGWRKKIELITVNF